MYDHQPVYFQFEYLKLKPKAVLSKEISERQQLLESPKVLSKNAAPDPHLWVKTHLYISKRLQGDLYHAKVWDLTSNPQHLLEVLEYLYNTLREERIIHLI